MCAEQPYTTSEESSSLRAAGPPGKTGDNVPATYRRLLSSEEEQVIRKWQELDRLGQLASDLDVSLIIDAEQSYLQKGIEVLAIDMMRKYNSHRPVIHNSYQCYLKNMHDVVVRDLELANREGFYLGLKVVRGAYIDEEQSRAVAMGYRAPTNPSYEATTRMYEKVSTTILRAIAGNHSGNCHVTFATHNMDSVIYVINRLVSELLTMDAEIRHVGFLVAKLLHYGSVEEGVAYLTRRLAENRAGLLAVDLERSLVWKEIRRRLHLA
ncbi:hypothetical protein LSH36_327g01008 [Paralvinella palmiformis]|uniref:Proline dehydrogenase n=1 Tax=Paralvinella palmiformis TaxID=53620 RepID=A0AAD9JGS5_9ANNE|nr:hypothetical protein LSH36_327g01008 [Paralvinella palmiformis]